LAQIRATKPLDLSKRTAATTTPKTGTSSALAGHPEAVDNRFETAEAAALSAWAHTPAARARVIEVRPRDENEVIVVIEVEGHPAYNRDLVTCERDETGWRWTGSTGSGSLYA
jgi:hypothetical protein